jgi:hypothetical protein
MANERWDRISERADAQRHEHKLKRKFPVLAPQQRKLAALGRTQCPDFPCHFRYDWIAFDHSRNFAFRLWIFASEHDLETTGVAIFERANIDSDYVRQRQQFLIVSGENSVNVSLWDGRIILSHVQTTPSYESQD